GYYCCSYTGSYNFG
nr:immunoglobulin light chain junction region [Macaca mulatta]